MDEVFVKKMDRTNIAEVVEFWKDKKIAWTSPYWVRNDVETILQQYDELKSRIVAGYLGYCKDQLIGYYELYKEEKDVLVANSFAISPAFHLNRNKILKDIFTKLLKASFENKFSKLTIYTNYKLIKFYKRFGFKWRINTDVIMDSYLPLVDKTNLLGKGLDIFQDISDIQARFYDSYTMNNHEVYDYVWKKNNKYCKITIDTISNGIVGYEDNYLCLKLIKKHESLYLYCKNVSPVRLNISFESSNCIQLDKNEKREIYIECINKELKEFNLLCTTGDIKKSIPFKYFDIVSHTKTGKLYFPKLLDTIGFYEKYDELYIKNKNHRYIINLRGMHISGYDLLVNKCLFKDISFKFGDKYFYHKPRLFPSQRCLYSWKIQRQSNCVIVSLFGQFEYLGLLVQTKYEIKIGCSNIIIQLYCNNSSRKMDVFAELGIQFDKEHVYIENDKAIIDFSDLYCNKQLNSFLKEFGSHNTIIETDHHYIKIKTVSSGEYNTEYVYYENSIEYDFSAPVSNRFKQLFEIELEFGGGNIYTYLEKNIMKNKKIKNLNLLNLENNTQKNMNELKYLSSFLPITTKYEEKCNHKLIHLSNNNLQVILSPSYNMGIISLKYKGQQLVKTYFPTHRKKRGIPYLCGGITPYIYSRRQNFPGALNLYFKDIDIIESENGIVFKTILNDQFFDNINLEIRYLLSDNGITIKVIFTNKSDTYQEFSFYCRSILSDLFDRNTQFNNGKQKVTFNSEEKIATRNQICILNSNIEIFNFLPHKDLEQKIYYGWLDHINVFFDHTANLLIKPQETLEIQSLLEVKIYEGGV